MVDEVAPLIDAMLRAEVLMKAAVIHERPATEYGFTGNYQRVKLYVQEARPRIAEEPARGGLAKTASTADTWCLARLQHREHGVLRDREIEVGVRVGLVVERVMPPLALVCTETARFHE